MLISISAFLLQVIAGLIGGACLLRMYMQYQRIGFANPVGQLIFAVSDWIVLPLRKIVKPYGRIDLSSLIAAYLIVLIQQILLMLLVGGPLALTPWFALIGLVRLVISGLTGLLFVYVILSWVGQGSPIASVIDRIVSPLLMPIRKVLPTVGGIDFSPFVALVLLQVASIALNYVR